MEPHTPPQPLAPVDYDQVQHQVYARGRALPATAVQQYMAVFGAHLPARRPLAGVDLGSGTGRFTPALAEAFGGPVFGVEPADGMRRTAEAEATHPQVTYLAGRAEAIPLADGVADFVLMFLSYHHVVDKPAAAREIARVLKPGGRLLLRSTFQERIPDHWWRGYFPRSWDVERAMFPTVAETQALFAAAGFHTQAVVQMELPFEGDLADAVARLKLRAVSTFEHMTEAELDEGFARLDADLARGAVVEKSTLGDFIVFASPAALQESAIA
ncbi:MAG: class I SAM-dependent methyltransferase [Caulobacterales bacterium]|nr:class I SAM-dependent methyltransferase [Caulobacterales bacterium]